MTHLLVGGAGCWRLLALTQILVLILSCEGHHVLLKDVASLRCISKILHMVEDACLAAGGYRMKDADTKSVSVKRAMGIIHSTPAG